MRHPHVVGHEHGGCPSPAGKRAQQVEHGVPGLGVEVARRLVREDQLRLADERPRDRDALLLAAGEHRRGVARAMPQPHIIQGGERSTARLTVVDPAQQQRHRDVLLGGEARHQVEALKDEAELHAPVGEHLAL